MHLALPIRRLRENTQRPHSIPCLGYTSKRKVHRVLSTRFFSGPGGPVRQGRQDWQQRWTTTTVRLCLLTRPSKPVVEWACPALVRAPGIILWAGVAWRGPDPAHSGGFFHCEIRTECLISGIPFALHIKNMRIFTIVPTATSAHYGTLHPCLVTTT
ncbi:hypothetical protein GWK47_004392 [Chionoecetes opilio]|uniref:Uncharacterized protein n=1 Tax=Chionoecetes opilio TaxID=41210 RepID=A0A8J4YFC4_CHIOP|nr:hypothetical protein GWK47_004392 [Chionoecetes opilio]